MNAIIIKNPIKYFRKTKVVDGISFEVERVCDWVGIIKKDKMVATESIISMKDKRLYMVKV